MIRFGSWLPDVSFYQQQSLYTAKNVIPDGEGYRPFPSFASDSTSLPLRVRGGILARGNTGVIKTFCGTEEKLYRFDSATNSFTDISDDTYTTVTQDTFWSFAQFGDYIIATNMSDEVRKYNFVTSPSSASLLGGSPPKARHVIVVKDQVVLCGLDGEEAAIQWSAINDMEGWTIGTNLCDKQVFPNGGRIMAAHGGEVGYILQERMVRLMIQAPGSPEIYQFQVISENRGCAAPRASVAVGGRIFFLANDGFYMIAGNSMKPIGDESINRWFVQNVNKQYLSRTVAGVNIIDKYVIWAFMSKDSSPSDIENYVCDRMLIYHWPTGKWAWSDERVTTFIDANAGLMSLEDLDVYGDLDSLPLSLDSAAYNTDQTISFLRMFDENNKIGQFEGPNQEALFEIKNIQIAPPWRQLVRRVHPVIDATDTEVSIGGHERAGDSVSWNDYVAIETNGWSHQHDSARMHSVRVKIPAGSTWTHARGIHLDAIRDGDI